MGKRLLDPFKREWWDAPRGRTFQARYMAFRYLYGLRAVDAFAAAKQYRSSAHPSGTLVEVGALVDAMHHG